jgi:hypothetical protein
MHYLSSVYSLTFPFLKKDHKRNKVDVFPLHLQSHSTSDNVRDLYRREVELWATNGRSNLAYNVISMGIVGVFYMPQSCDMGLTALLPLRRKEC